MKKRSNGLLIFFAVVFFCFSAIMLVNGINKMTVYNNSDYEDINENAYVGGDAYNYIINGTYSTSFFALSSGFFIGGMICVATAEIKNAIYWKSANSVDEKNIENTQTFNS